MLALLKTRRWISFTILVIVVIIAFGLLSRWQWARAEERRVQRTEIANAQTPVPFDPATNAEWQPVTLTGSYEDQQTLVRRRPLNGRNGFWVVSSMNGVPIVRGWIPATGAPTDVVTPPAPPAGTVTVVGRFRDAEEASDDGGLPEGQVMNLSTPYVQLTSSDPDQAGLQPLPLPEVDEGRNISYAVQWILFALVATIGWFFFLRREARDSIRPSS